MLVEDNATFAGSVQNFLKMVTGLKVVGHAFNGPEAIKKMLEIHPELVLMDIGLGGMNGFEVAGLLLSLDKPPDVIFLSMHDGEVYRKKALQMGAAGFISKTNFATDLFPLIDRIIERRLMH